MLLCLPQGLALVLIVQGGLSPHSHSSYKEGEKGTGRHAHSLYKLSLETFHIASFHILLSRTESHGHTHLQSRLENVIFNYVKLPCAQVKFHVFLLKENERMDIGRQLSVSTMFSMKFDIPFSTNQHVLKNIPFNDINMLHPSYEFIVFIERMYCNIIYLLLMETFFFFFFYNYQQCCDENLYTITCSVCPIITV